MTSSDTHGPLIRPRSEKLWTWVDPLQFRTNFRYEFEMEIFSALETESTAIVTVGDKTLKKGSSFNDYYGFGTSRDQAIKEATVFVADLAGANVDVLVTTKLFTQAVFIDEKKKPFYNGAVRCFQVPGSWRRQDGDGSLGTSETFQSWKNGVDTADAKRLQRIIADAKLADAAGPYRNGALR